MTTDSNATAFQPAAIDFHTATLTAHEHIGFELGWDYAHYRLLPPAPYDQEPSPLRNGLLAGQAAFGARTLAPSRAVRKWLQLRLHAWLRGRSVELFQVTPHYLQQLDVSHCPVTRAALSNATLEGSDASIDRVRNDAGYAAGNLMVMSTKANHAKAAHGYPAARQIARDAIQRHDAGDPDHSADDSAGLSAGQWARIATLCSFVEPLSHDEACTVPLLVMPPNRLRLFNPAQALQAFISQQLMRPGWGKRNCRFEALIPGKASRRAFQAFFHALLPRVLEAGAGADALRLRWAIEDAWQNALVQQRWAAFARQLTAVQCEALLLRATAKQLGSGRLERLDEGAATEGWNLESRGYVPHAVLMKRSARPPARRADPRQVSLPL